MILIFLGICFLLLYALLFLYYYTAWKKAFIHPTEPFSPIEFTSVLIPARNEESTLPRLLDALQNQSLSKEVFEIIVIDDFSTDRTAELARNSGISNLRVIQPDADASHSSKKRAIETGVQKAKGTLIVTTDADCIPGSDWLKSVMEFASATGANFIAAPVKFTTDGSFLQNFQAIDFMTLQGITAASVSSGFHTMCNGANLAYTKQAFISVNGFEGIDRVASGDDMLLMHKIWKQDPSRVYYLKDEKAMVRTDPMKTWKEFFNQRKRWASKTLVYDDYRILVVLGFVYLFNCLFIILFIYACLHAGYWWYVLGYIVFKPIIELPFISSVARFYGYGGLVKRFIFLQPIHICYMVAAGFISQLGGYEWKGRKTK